MPSILLLAALAAAAPQVVIELASEPGNSATGVPIGDYDTALAESLVRDLEQRGVSAAVHGAAGASDGARLTVLLHHHAIPQQWIDGGHAAAFYGFAVGVSSANRDMPTTVTCARMMGTALREAGELPSLYRAMKLPQLDQPLIDEAVGIHQVDGNTALSGRDAAAVELEVGIVSHPTDSRRLANPVVVSGLADAIGRGIDGCLNPVPDDDDVEDTDEA